MTTTFPTLYKKTSTGAIQLWEVSVQDSTIVTNFGQLDGKIQETRDTITEGKNIGRSNETTAQTQALAEAQSQWEKKLKKRYVKTIEEAKAGTTDEIIAGGIAPMLAHKFSEQGHKIFYPCYVQPKLDGHRCVAIIEDGKATLWSRSQKPITGVPHIIAELEALNLDDCVIDGELYNHDYKERFEELTSFIKRDTPKEGHQVVQYHIYDVADEDMNFGERSVWLTESITHVEWSSAASSLVLVDTKLVDSHEAMIDEFDSYRASGYEGLMVRNAASSYVNKRSYDLQKVKEFDDAEFEIVGVVPGRGKLTEMGMFICKTEDGSTFECKMKGELEGLKKFLANPQEYIGQQLVIQYQGLTKNGIPRFGVGLRLREDV